MARQLISAGTRSRTAGARNCLLDGFVPEHTMISSSVRLRR